MRHAGNDFIRIGLNIFPQFRSLTGEEILLLLWNQRIVISNNEIHRENEKILSIMKTLVRSDTIIKLSDGNKE